MTKVQQIVTDRKTVRGLVEFMEETVKSREEVRARKVKHFKDPKDLLNDLHSPD